MPGFETDELNTEKKTLHSKERESERVKQLRLDWREKTNALSFQSRIWFLDETGMNLSLAREYARSFGGGRAVGSVPKNYGEGVTLLGAINRSGELAALEVRGATDEQVMLVFINEVLSQVLSSGDSIVLDNLSAHKTRRVQQAFAALGVEVYYLPPYSPDLNPIEKCWSKLKTFLRSKAARSYQTLSEAITEGLKTITAADAGNWINHCGYV